jgi:hypothetical protein
MFLLSCGGGSSEINSTNDQDIDSEETTLDIVEPMENPAELFTEYKEKCEKMLSEESDLEDATSLRSEAFSSKYQRDQPEGATDWGLETVLYVSDMQLGMEVVSDFEGVTNHYIVSMDEFGFIHQFDLIGSSLEATYEFNVLDDETFLLTERRGYNIVDGEIYDGLNVVNTIYELAGMGYIATEDEMEIPETSDKFFIYIGDTDSEMSVKYTTVETEMGDKLQIDVYYGVDFFTRLPSHEVNNWTPDVQEAKFQTGDYNSDGTEDVMITLQAISGVGPDGVVPFDATTIYFQDDYLNFQKAQDVQDQLKDGMTEEEIKEICSSVRFGEIENP